MKRYSQHISKGFFASSRIKQVLWAFIVLTSVFFVAVALAVGSSPVETAKPAYKPWKPAPKPPASEDVTDVSIGGIWDSILKGTGKKGTTESTLDSTSSRVAIPAPAASAPATVGTPDLTTGTSGRQTRRGDTGGGSTGGSRGEDPSPPPPPPPPPCEDCEDPPCEEPAGCEEVPVTDVVTELILAQVQTIQDAAGGAGPDAEGLLAEAEKAAADGAAVVAAAVSGAVEGIVGEGGIIAQAQDAVAGVQEAITGEGGITESIQIAIDFVKGLLPGGADPDATREFAFQMVGTTQEIVTAAAEGASEDAQTAGDDASDAADQAVSDAQALALGTAAYAEEEAQRQLTGAGEQAAALEAEGARRTEEAQKAADDAAKAVQEAPAKAMAEVLVGAYVVNASDSKGTAVPVLGGHNYRFRVSGTYDYWFGQNGFLADAECAAAPGISDTWGPSLNTTAAGDGLDLVFGPPTNIDWVPATSGAAGCSDTHEYYYDFTPVNNQLWNFRIYQHVTTEYANNFGALTVRVYELAPVEAPAGIAGESTLGWGLVAILAVNLAAGALRRRSSVEIIEG